MNGTQFHLAMVLTLILAVSGCTTTPTYETIPLEEITLKQIEATIASGEPILAMQDLSALTRIREIPDDRVTSIYAEATRVLAKQLEQATAEWDFLRAYAVVRSLELIDDDDTSVAWDTEAVLLGLAERFKERGEELPALLLKLKSIGYAGTPEATLRTILREAELGGFDSIVRYAGEQLGYESDRSLESPIETSRLVESTVTIWVNRGMRIERGVGYPDRVIGSGFFIDGDGYLITNYHVIESEVDPEYEGFSRLYVRPSGDATTRIPATVVGWDRVFDLALLKVDMEPDYLFSPAVDVKVAPGDRIFAIGSPAGLTQTITSGIISATGRRFFQMGDAVQVDVPVNPGNSGGPLVDDRGELVGVVFAGIEQFEGINFAIPARWINSSLPRLFLGGEVIYPWMGAVVTEVDDGLEILYVVPGEPAHRAGLESGDVLTTLAGEEVSTTDSAQAELIDLVPGTLVPVRWNRDGVALSGSLALADRPAYPIDLALERDVPIHLVEPLFGMTLERTGRSILGDSYVVKEVIRGGIADETGISPNDPLRIEGLEIDSENRVALLTLVVQKPKAGFIERAIQLGAYLEIDSFL